MGVTRRERRLANESKRSHRLRFKCTEEAGNTVTLLPRQSDRSVEVAGGLSG